MRDMGSIILGLALFAISIAAGAQNLLYANNAGFDDRIDVINRDTGALIRSCFPNKPSGHGLVVIGNIAYHTVATTNSIYKMDMNTCADLGIAFSVAGATAVSSIAYDGTNFWIYDYEAGSNKLFYYTPTGTLLKTIRPVNCQEACDGLEFFNGKLISNRGDFTGPYDIYDTNRTLLTPNFITTANQPTGIAYDGTYFYVALLNPAGTIRVFDGATGAFVRQMTITNGGGNTFLLEDLSTDYSLRADTGGGGGGEVAAAEGAVRSRFQRTPQRSPIGVSSCSA